MENSSPEFNYTSSSPSQASSVKQVGFPDELMAGSSQQEPALNIVTHDTPKIPSGQRLLDNSAQNKSKASKSLINKPRTNRSLQKYNASIDHGQSVPSNNNLPKIQVTYSTAPLLGNQKNGCWQQEAVPQPMVWIERCPYSRQVINYQQRVVYVPVQRIERGEYQIQHIIEFARRQVPEIRLQLQQRQVVDYKLQYVPVQSKILHLPARCVSPCPNFLSTINQQPQFQTTTSKLTSEFKSKFVTTPTYDYNLRAQQMKMIEAKMQMLKHKEKQLRPIS